MSQELQREEIGQESP